MAVKVIHGLYHFLSYSQYETRKPLHSGKQHHPSYTPDRNYYNQFTWEGVTICLQVGGYTALEPVAPKHQALVLWEEGDHFWKEPS